MTESLAVQVHGEDKFELCTENARCFFNYGSPSDLDKRTVDHWIRNKIQIELHIIHIFVDRPNNIYDDE